MNESGIDLLLDGEPIGGVLRFPCGAEEERVSGTIQLIRNQVVVSFTSDPMTPLAAALMPGHKLVLNGEEIVPLSASQMAFFDSRLGSITLIHLGSPEILPHTLTYPVEFRLRPRFTVLASIEEPYWRRPTMVMAEIGGLAAWMHGGRVTRSGSLKYEPTVDDTNHCLLSFRDFAESTFQFDDSISTVTLRQLHALSRSDSRDELAIRFRSTAIIERSSETTWTQALDTIDAVQELVNFLSWSNQDWSFLHCKFGIPTTVDNDYWDSIGVPPPPEFDERWSRTLTVRSREDHPATKNLEFIMPFDELTKSSIDIWFQLRDEFGEGLRQMLQVVKAPSMTPEVRALQLGAGVERLGFRSLAAKSNSKKADRVAAKKLFREIAAEAVRLLPEAFGAWSENANNNYQFMKHLGRDGVAPTVGELARTNDIVSAL